MSIRFTKMHGIGNDYIYVNLLAERVEDAAAFAIAVSNRHFGIGGDGAIFIGPGEQGDLSMRIFNADGSEAQMCGNGIRCVAKYACDHGLAQGDLISVETAAGLKTIEVFREGGKVVSARVDMGLPALARRDIPMTGPPGEQCVNETFSINGNDYSATCVNMGNPHCVIFVDDVDAIALEADGAALENHEVFPERTNVHFAQVISESELRMRTWERGSGVTLACGTGAGAVCVAGAITHRTARQVLIHLPGGDLELEWAEDDHLFMTGPATEVFSGEWPEDED